MRDQPGQNQMSGQRAAVPGIFERLLLGLRVAIILQSCDSQPVKKNTMSCLYSTQLP